MDDVSAGGLIYLVEDDPDVRVSFVWMLEAYGFRIEAFATPLAFLEATLSPEPHCVIMDLRLPELSGIETLERLRRRGDRAPVIIVTGHGDIKAADEARALGAFDFLEKPFDDQLFVERLNAALASASADP